MVSIRAVGVPIGVTILATVLGVFATGIGLLALVDPTQALGYVAGADALATGWAGRNAGLGVALLVAVVLRNPYGYVVAFAAQVLREVGDVVTALPSAAGVAVAGAFLAADLVGLLLSVRALRRTPSRRAS